MKPVDDAYLHIDLEEETSTEVAASVTTTHVATNNRAAVVLGLLALVALIVLGTVALSSPPTQGEPDETAARTPDADVENSAAPVELVSPEDISRELPEFTVLQAANMFDTPIVLVPILEGSQVDDPLILVVERGELRYRSLRTSLWTGNNDRVVRLNPGMGPHPMIVSANHASIATLEGIHAQGLALDEPSQALAQGISILPSAVPDSVWAIGNSGNNVALVDLVSGTSIAEGSLAGFGYPLGAVANGLLVAPDAAGSVDYTVWSTTRDPVALRSTGSSKLLGFNQTEAFFETKDEVVVFDLKSGEPRRTLSLDLPEFRTGSLASPDGSRLAVSFQPSVIENNTIVVFDTTTGEPTTAIDDALPWQFQWVDNDRLLYMQSDFPTFRIAVHDYRTNETIQLIEFDDFGWWFATTSTLGP